jgi:quercetin dioxygenase-like cupin family protein
MKNMFFIAVLLAASVAAAQEKRVPADQEPFHKVVLKNDYVEVMHVTIPPGQSTMLHTHSHNRAAVILSNSTLWEDLPGTKSAQSMIVHAGGISSQEIAAQPFTHRIKNVGKTTFEVLDIEVLKRPDGPATEAITTPAAENAGLRAYRWALSPGASTPQHTHSRPYLIIAATPMQLAMKAPDGSSMEHPIKAGDFHWIDSKVTHTLTNNGKEAGIIVEVELR